ncbi:hypothetical protein BTH160X_50197 [Brochothrix thermosphacta]|nr:hypothetical protein BTH160X_50197 [Brochothrix thermosphacta]
MSIPRRYIHQITSVSNTILKIA